MIGDRVPKVKITLVALRAFESRWAGFESAQLPSHHLAKSGERKQIRIYERRAKIDLRDIERWTFVTFSPKADP
jgi:hypothetical protein